MILLLLACGTPETPAITAPPVVPAAPAASTAAAPVPLEAEVLRLAALVPTSGSAEAVLDGNPTIGWTPVGDPRGEGLLLRFEKPTMVSTVALQACGGREFEVTPFFNGTEGDPIQVAPRGEGDADRALRSLFLRVDDGQACIGELTLLDGEGVRIPVAAPRAMTGTVTATSTLAPAPAYHPDYLFDSRLDFGWVEGSEGLGVGEVITVAFDRPTTVAKLEIWNGYQRSQDHFDKNARLERIAVSVGGARQEFDVDPLRFGSQVLTFAAPVNAKELKIEILASAAGSKYRDLVISELRIWDDVGPLSLKPNGAASRAQELKASAKGTAVAPLIDKLYRGFCDDEGSRWLKLRSDHSFVWYEAVEDATEIFDGAWVLTGPREGGSGIQLYGRRHRSQEAWQPYEQTDGPNETIKIGGGKPVITPVAGMDPATFAQQVGQVKLAFGRDCAYDQSTLAAAGAVIVRDPSMTDVLVPRQ